MMCPFGKALLRQSQLLLELLGMCHRFFHFGKKALCRSVFRIQPQHGLCLGTSFAQMARL